jgi:hypothetical protein
MPDDDQITQRLHSALETEARRNALPSDFATNVAGSLEDRASRRFSWFSGLPAVAATVVLAIVAVAIPLSLTRPPTPGPGASQSTTPERTVAASAATSSTISTMSPTADGSPRPLTEAEAVDAALRADGRPGMSAANVESGPASEVLPREGFEWADVPSGDTWVWLIVVSDDGPPLGQEGSFVVLDYFDGTVYGIQNWIS